MGALSDFEEEEVERAVAKLDRIEELTLSAWLEKFPGIERGWLGGGMRFWGSWGRRRSFARRFSRRVRHWLRRSSD
jgi:hypothetical protein